MVMHSEEKQVRQSGQAQFPRKAGYSRNSSARYRSYLLRLALVPFVLVSYPALSLFGPYDGRAEFYPFFPWNLFPRSTEIRSDVVIFVEEVNGRKLPEPVLFFDMPEQFAAAKKKDIRLGKMLNNLVRAEFNGNADMVEKLRSVIKRTFMSDVEYVAYNISIIKYNALDRYRNNEIIEEIIVLSDEKVE